MSGLEAAQGALDVKDGPNARQEEVRRHADGRTNAASGKDQMTAWLDRVRDGGWGHIPWHITFEQASELALLIEGYDVAGGIAEVMAISRRVIDDIMRTERTRATALDIWIALFA